MATKPVRELAAQEVRVETGAIQFGNDWPGLFVRGDNAFALSIAITLMRKSLRDDLLPSQRIMLAPLR